MWQFENTRPTYIYYGSWDPSLDNDGGRAVGLAMIRRNGSGFLSVRDPDALLTTEPIANKGRAAVVKQSGLRVKTIEPRGGAMNFAKPQFRVRIRLTGSAAGQARFYAASIE